MEYQDQVMVQGEGEGLVGDITGSGNAAMRLILSLFASYPIVLIYRAILLESPSTLRLLYWAGTGIVIGIFNCGYEVYHSLLGVLFTYISLKVLGRTKLLVYCNLLFHCGYLLLGYVYTSTDSYDITWTMPHCILVLKLIGLAFDYWDGGKDPSKISANTKITAITGEPSLLQVLAFTYFPPGFLVGPQITMNRFLDFIDGKYEGDHDPPGVRQGILRGFLGVAYLGIFQFGSNYFYEDHLLTEEFARKSQITKHAYIAIWGKVVLCKYLACWLLTEGACITCGIAYNGKDGERTKWDGCRNIRVKRFEGITKFSHYIECFNVNTNAWVSRNIYKRCASFGNKLISQAISLFFLAAWHGMHSGYYMAFVFEFIVLIMERDLEVIAAKYPKLESLLMGTLPAKVVFLCVRKVYTMVFISWALIPFTLLRFDRWWAVYSTLNYSGFIFFVPWLFAYKPIVKFIVSMMFAEKKKSS